MRTFFSIMSLMTLLFSGSPAAMAQSAPQASDLAELTWLTENDPAAALQTVDAALSEASGDTAADPRLIFDLNNLKADLLIRLGKQTEAAELLIGLAKYAIRHRNTLDVDPAPILATAAALFETQGNYRQAGQALTAKLEEQRDGGQGGAVLALTLEELARLSDLLSKPEDAQNYRTAAAKARDHTPVGPSRSDDKGFRAVDVYYATDRARTGKAEPSEFYGYGRGQLELGVATVTIPVDHTPGQVESPSIWRLEFGPSPAKHVVLQSVTPVETDVFYTQLQAEFDGTEKTEAFVFVHGYNVRFDQATKRAAQIAYDMEYGGVPIVYSWPSHGSTYSYVADTAVVQLSARRLSHFLDDLVDRSGATTIHIVAHSMGNRALTEALELMALRRGVQAGDPPVLGQVLFAAPDVDAGLFAEMIPTFRPLAQRLTLYASESDWALVTSRKLHGDAPRAGQGGEDTLAVPMIDSIDMSALGEDMLAHSYFADDANALADMMALFWQNAAPMLRCGLIEDRASQEAIPVWRYEPGSCFDQHLIDVLAMLRRLNVTSPEDIQAALAKTIQDAELRANLESVVMRIAGQ